jgi:hypothetical protein
MHLKHSRPSSDVWFLRRSHNPNSALAEPTYRTLPTQSHLLETREK